VVRPFTLGRLADLIRLAKVSRGITVDDVEGALMVSHGRALELLKQAEEMKLLKVDGSVYLPTSLGSAFFEAVNSGNREKLDYIFGEYSPYLTVKNVLLKQSASLADLKRLTGLNEVAIEIILRLLQYIRDDILCINEKFFIRNKEKTNLDDFVTSVSKAYKEINKRMQWGKRKVFIRLDKIASHVCCELCISIGDFSMLLGKALEHYPQLEVYSEVISFQFLPFYHPRIPSTKLSKCYLYLRRS